MNAIISSLSSTMIPFVAQAKTSSEVWTILANTYAKPSCGSIKKVMSQLKKITKGPKSVNKFLQTMNARVDKLALLGIPRDVEDLTDKILNGLENEYKELVCAFQAWGTSITFEELHEKFLNFEASIHTAKAEAFYFPNTGNPTMWSTRNLFSP